MNLTKKQKLVYAVIQDYPQAANDDAMLLERVWQREGWDESKSLYWNLSRVTRPETISRRRRELFNLGLIEYSAEAEETRQEAFKNELEAHSDNQPAYAAVSWLNETDECAV